MRRLFAALAMAVGLMTAPASAQNLLPAFTQFVLDPSCNNGATCAKLIANPPRIDFASQNTSSAEAEFTVTSSNVFNLLIGGQDSAQASFVFQITEGQTVVFSQTFNFSGLGNPTDFSAVISLDPGTYTFTAFTQSSGNNFQGQITTATLVAVPGPVAGTGLVGLALLGGMAWRRRRRTQISA